MTSPIQFNQRVIDERMQAIRDEVNREPGFTLNESYSSIQQRREAMKREQTHRAITAGIDVIMLLLLALCALATIWLIAFGTLPLLGGCAVLAAIAVIACCICYSFSNH